MSQSVKIAALIFLVIVGYFLVRGVFAGPEGDDVAQAEKDPLFAVLTEDIAPKAWRDEVVVRGVTESIRKIIIRSETVGAVAETPARLGDLVKEGDVLCRIKTDARNAQLAEARAALAKARLDYDAARKLAADGFRSETAVATAKAARDQAAAAVERAQVELDKTVIVAPFVGVFDKRLVEVGDFVSVGDPCGELIQQSPILITGAVSETNVSKISRGDPGAATLATGETVNGEVRFVASSADPATRTFDVELLVDNPDGAIRDGVTATFRIFAESREAYRVPHSSLVLNDAGVFGVRLVNDENIVEFSPVSLLGEDDGGVWVRGLDGVAQLITRGQDYVKAGQSVIVGQPEGAGS